MEWKEEDKTKAQEHYYLACGKKSTEAIQAFHSVLLLLFNQTTRNFNGLQHEQRSMTIMSWMSWRYILQADTSTDIGDISARKWWSQSPLNKQSIHF